MGNHRSIRIGIVAIILTALAWQCIGAWQDSQTTDEGTHLVSGRSYWQTGSFALNPEHPSLFKLWASWPLLLLPNSAIQTDSAVWQGQNQWLIAAEYLWASPVSTHYGTHLLIFLGRLPMILIWLGLVIMIAVASWRQWGAWASLVATGFIAYDPNFLGHGHLVTNDVATAGAYLGVFLALRWLVHAPSWRRTVLFAFIFALAQLTKFSAAVLWLAVPVTLAIAIWYRLPRMTWRWWRRIALACIVVTSVATWAAYGFQINRIDRDPAIAKLWTERQNLINQQALDTVPPYTRLFIRLADPQSASGRFLARAQTWSMPAYWYWRGFFSAANHNVDGHEAFLFGRMSEQGWWYYFPVASAVKTPLPLLLFIVLAGIFGLARWRHDRGSWPERRPFNFWIFGAPPIVFLIASLFSHINIGLRHIFPTYVFFPFAAAYFISVIQQLRPRLTPVLAIATVLTTIIVATSAWPNTIGYFNAFAGGTPSGEKILLDSNLDWNQDIWRLQTFLNQHRFPEVHLAIFGSVPVFNVIPNLLPIPTDTDIAAGTKPSGIVVTSRGLLNYYDSTYQWLKTRTPRWNIGSSIIVYDFR